MLPYILTFDFDLILRSFFTFWLFAGPLLLSSFKSEEKEEEDEEE